jgi:hypothetical protein
MSHICMYMYVIHMYTHIHTHTHTHTHTRTHTHAQSAVDAASLVSGQSGVDSLSHKEAEEQQENYFASLDKKDDVRPEVKKKSN